jgi:hypothetical protein
MDQLATAHLWRKPKASQTCTQDDRSCGKLDYRINFQSDDCAKYFILFLVIFDENWSWLLCGLPTSWHVKLHEIKHDRSGHFKTFFSFFTVSERHFLVRCDQTRLTTNGCPEGRNLQD